MNRTLSIFALCATMVLLVHSVASAQDPFRDCFRDCAALYNEEADESSAEAQTMDQLVARCRNEVPTCRTLDESAMRAIGVWCDRAHARRTGRAPSSGTPPTFCVAPEGTTRDEARSRCHCPDSAPYALAVSRRRSGDLHIEGLRRGDQVFVCYNPLAPRGAPGSADERLTAVELEPIMRALEALQENAQEMQEEIDGAIDMIGALSRRMDVLTECLIRGVDHRVTYTDSTGVTQDYACPDILAAADRRVLDRAREAARTEARTVTRDELARLEAERRERGDVSFVVVQAYFLISFNEISAANTSYGVPWQIGGELTFGVSLGGRWNFHGGLGVGGAGPDVPGVTNVGGLVNLGLGYWADPMAMIGFGFIATHRFMYDVRSVDSLYGVYADVTARFMPRDEWSLVLTPRIMVGASPHDTGDGNWTAVPNFGIQVLVGVGHY